MTLPRSAYSLYACLIIEDSGNSSAWLQVKIPPKGRRHHDNRDLQNQQRLVLGSESTTTLRSRIVPPDISNAA